MSASARATAGAAIEVPDLRPKPPPGREDQMSVPGAISTVFGEALENDATFPVASWAPTAMTGAAQAGNETAVAAPSLPEDATTAMPASWTACMADSIAPLIPLHGDA